MPDNWEQVAPVYVETLADIPDDLIAEAFNRVLRECKFWPRPAEIREMVAPDLSRRRTAVSRLQHALWKADHP